MTGILKIVIKPCWDGNTTLHGLPSKFMVFIKIVKDEHHTKHKEEEDNTL
jgi:hypothetical protein